MPECRLRIRKSQLLTKREICLRHPPSWLAIFTKTWSKRSTIKCNIHNSNQKLLQTSRLSPDNNLAVVGPNLHLKSLPANKPSPSTNKIPNRNLHSENPKAVVHTRRQLTKKTSRNYNSSWKRWMMKSCKNMTSSC